MTIKDIDDGSMRSFSTGATRDTADGKIDMEGFTHPLVELQFAKYMNMNRLQADGKLRDSSNWQKGIPLDTYIKSLRRHHDDVWMEHRGFETGSGIISALCGVIFNAKGYLLEHLKANDYILQDFDGYDPTPEMKIRQEAIKHLEEDYKSICCEDVPEVCETPDDPTPDYIEVVGWNPIMEAYEKWHKWFSDGGGEDLEDVPEVPVCFGRECGTICAGCKDEEECNTIGCDVCDFASECEQAEIEVLYDTEDDRPYGEGAESCDECVCSDRMWHTWPCRDCSHNPQCQGLTPKADDYFLQAVKKSALCSCDKCVTGVGWYDCDGDLKDHAVKEKQKNDSLRATRLDVKTKDIPEIA